MNSKLEIEFELDIPFEEFDQSQFEINLKNFFRTIGISEEAIEKIEIRKGKIKDLNDEKNMDKFQQKFFGK